MPARLARNAVIAATSAAVVQAVERPIARYLTAVVARRGWGLLQALRLPGWLPGWMETVSAVVLLDYTLYVWHVLTHRVPTLWRVHLVHHIDRDLDVTTAVRFHGAELLLSVPWRAGQILLIGVRPRALSIWQTVTLISVMFHHSNLRLPVGVERKLGKVFVTPRMHGIHHSTVEEERNSNWSSGLTWWDRLHGTLRLDVPQEEIMIGVPPYRDESVGLGRLLTSPFQPQRRRMERRRSSVGVRAQPARAERAV